MPKSKMNFTFVLTGHAKTLHLLHNNDSEEPPFISIKGATYQSAINKLLKLKVPNIEKEEDVIWFSIEELDEEDEILEKISSE